jgi:EAL domain-containing protein (putative c-di-GMP-specific phosphodiesterase class I)/GGDEF domain-containing protein
MTRALYCGERRKDWLLARAILDEGAADASPMVHLEWAGTPAAARAALRRSAFDVALVDHGPEGAGMGLLLEDPDLPISTPIIYLVPDEGAAELMQEALALGAVDVLVRSSLAPAELRWALQKACRRPARQGPGARAEPLGVLSGEAMFSDRVDRALHRARRTRLAVAVLSLTVIPGDDGADHLLHLGNAAERIRRSIRVTDSLCRLTSDCFLVLLEDLDEGPAAARVADRILKSLEGDVDLDASRRLGAELGIALHPQDGSAPEALIDAAKRAVESAMDLGPGTSGFRFSSRPLHRRAARRSRLERALRRDVATMAFELHFQPRIDLRSGHAVGVEALLRYHPRDLGPVGPSEVVPLLEEMEKIEAVGGWVLSEACRVARTFEEAGNPLVMGVNVSAHQVELGRLDRAVERALAESGLTPALLELELTEGVLIENTAGTRRLLAGLRERGVRIAVDDFGTGYASLRYVKHFPMDAIKIDREFVRGLPSDPENVAITSAIIALAHRLDIEVVAEGVEEQAEESFLREHGCDYVQGFLRARPMPEPQILPWLTKRPGSPSGIRAAGAVDSETEIG